MNRKPPVLVSVLFAFMSFALGQQYELTSLDFPGALATQAYGINPQGDIVGFYLSADGVPHCFLYHNDEWITLDIEYPSVEYFTDIVGINPSGNLIGTTGLKYPWEDCGPRDGFYSTGDSLEAVTYPGAHDTWIWGINPKGVMVGTALGYEYSGSCEGMVLLWSAGFVLEDGVFTPLNPPNSGQWVSADDINAAGDILGSYTDTVLWERHDFILKGDKYTIIEPPEGVPDFGPRAIGPNGMLAGVYGDLSSGFKSFVWFQDNFISIEMPGAFHTFVNDISPSGVVVGRYLDATGHHGFVGKPCPGGQTCSQEP
jgi:probable HAF family extracellular repeat protein